MTTDSIPVIETAVVMGEDIERLVNMLRTVLDNEPAPHIIVTCLTVAFLAQNPFLSMQDLEEGVAGASKWMATFVAEKDIGCEIGAVGRAN